jgi:hypothetical protein
MMTTIIEILAQILAHTPVWVFPLIATVIWLGSRSLSERTLTLRSLILLPLVILMLSIGGSIATSANPLLAVVGWVVAAALGGAVGCSASRQPRSIDVAAGDIIVPGSVVPLLVIIAIVAWRYVFGYLYGRYPALRADGDYALALIVGNALLGGVMLGRACRYGATYWRARSADHGMVR